MKYPDPQLMAALDWAYYELRDLGLIEPVEEYAYHGLTVEKVEELLKDHPQRVRILARLREIIHSDRNDALSVFPTVYH